MELPRNITQVGETDRNCKIYVEDYVVSYMKQMNKFAEEKELTVALFGKMTEEQQITYCFVYGAALVQSISKEVRHLSQAQNQEVERLRKKYFPEQIFLGYQILNGEMIEGFRIYDQNSCRYVKGYACFFEKNDTMLAYMLENRSEEVQPEKVEQDKYDVVKKRQEDRRQQFEERTYSRRRSGIEFGDVQEKSQETEKESRRESEMTAAETGGRQFKIMPMIAVAGCCLLALIFMERNGSMVTLKRQMNTWLGGVAEQKLDETDDVATGDLAAAESEEVQAVLSTLVTEDKLVNAIMEENEKAAEASTVPDNVPQETISLQPTSPPQDLTVSETTPAPQMTAEPQTGPVPETTPAPQITAEPQTDPLPEPTSVPQATATPQVSQQTIQQPQTYIIRQGDTLIAISRSLYGSEEYVKEICRLNGISNPDNIQIGQKILLP